MFSCPLVDTCNISVIASGIPYCMPILIFIVTCVGGSTGWRTKTATAMRQLQKTFVFPRRWGSLEDLVDTSLCKSPEEMGQKKLPATNHCVAAVYTRQSTMFLQWQAYADSSLFMVTGPAELKCAKNSNLIQLRQLNDCRRSCLMTQIWWNSSDPPIWITITT